MLKHKPRMLLLMKLSKLPQMRISKSSAVFPSFKMQSQRFTLSQAMH